MYAIVKSGGKQYKVAAGDKLNVEKIPAEVGDKIQLEPICIVDGDNVEADPEKAANTKVEAVVLEQFRDKKVIVFKFKKRKNYKKKRGHRQSLTRIQVTEVGSDKYQGPKEAEKNKSKEPEAGDSASGGSAPKADAKAEDAKTE